MRVALLCPGQLGASLFDPATSDSGYGLARALASKSHDVHVFEPVLARTSGYSKAGGVHRHTVSVTGRSTSLQEVVDFSLAYYIRCTQSLAGAFDVVHCFDNSLIPLAGQMSRSGSTKAFLSIDSDQSASPTSFLSAKNRGWNVEEAVDQVVVTRRTLKYKLLSQLRLQDARVVVMGPGIEFDRFSRWVDQGKVKQQYHIGPVDPVALFVGEFCQGSRVEFLLEATFELIRQFASFKAIFAGDGPMLPYLRERAKVLGIEGSIRFASFVPEDQLISLYNGCDMVFVPFDDTFGERVVLEAWSAGKPTIVFREAAPEFVEAGTDALAIETSCDSLVEAIRFVLVDPARASTMGNCAWRKVSAEFSWSAIADKTIQMYSNTTSRRTLS